MKTIKLFDGCKLTVDGQSEEFRPFGWDDVCKAIHIPADCKDGLFRHLFTFGRLDLSPAYAGHEVVVELIPAKD